MRFPCNASVYLRHGGPTYQRILPFPLTLVMMKLTLSCQLLSLVIAGAFVVNAQYGPDPYGKDRNGSFPHAYPGMPEGQFSPEWQNCTSMILVCAESLTHSSLYADFQVTDRLPNVTFDLGRNWAGNIPVGRSGPNNTLFFWAWEKVGQNGSLTAPAVNNTDPWIIWLQGG